MKRYVLNFWPFAAILVAVAIFFYPVFLQGKVPLPGDFIVGVYYPWLDYKWAGYNAGVPVKNPITTDVVSFTYPIQMYTVELLKSGLAPLWNNLILAGTPLLANFQSAPFSPTNLLYFFLPKLLSWSLQIMAQPALAASFLYLLLRNFNLSKLSSVAGGLFYAFAGFNLIWMQWNGHSLVAAFFPLVILLVKKWLETSKIFWGILISITLALQFFSGYPQIILYEFLALLLLILVFDRKTLTNFKKLFMLSLFITLGITTAAVQILPGLELLNHSQREIEQVTNEWAFLPPQMIITFFAPDYFGNHATGNYWGPADYTLTTGFSGTVVLILALIGFIAKRKEKGVTFAYLLVLLSLAIAFPNPITVAIKESGILGLQAASAHRALVLSNLGFAILASFGLSTLMQGEVKRLQILRAFYIPAILLFGFAIGTYISFFQIGPTLGSNLKIGLRNLILPIGLLISSGLLICMGIYFKKSTIMLLVLIFLAIFELFRFGWKFTPFSEKDFVYPKTPVLEFLQKQEKPFRVAAEDVVPINMMMPYEIETVEGYDAVYPLNYAQYLAALNSEQVGGDPMGRYGSVSNVNSKLFDLANGKYVLALKRDQEGKPDTTGNIPEKFSNPKLKKVFEDKTVVVLENISALPRAFFVSDWISESSRTKVLENLLEKDFPLDKRIVLEEDFQDFTPSKGNKSQVEILNSNEIHLKTTNPGFLFISNNFYPGWKAEVDGIQAEILRANYTFQAVPVYQDGDYKIRLSYDPQSFKIGKVISLISVVFLGMIGGIKYGRKFTQT